MPISLRPLLKRLFVILLVAGFVPQGAMALPPSPEKVIASLQPSLFAFVRVTGGRQADEKCSPHLLSDGDRAKLKASFAENVRQLQRGLKAMGGDQQYSSGKITAAYSQGAVYATRFKSCGDNAKEAAANALKESSCINRTMTALTPGYCFLPEVAAEAPTPIISGDVPVDPAFSRPSLATPSLIPVTRPAETPTTVTAPATAAEASMAPAATGTTTKTTAPAAADGAPFVTNPDNEAPALPVPMAPGAPVD